jgi:hypothetical protein
MTTQQILSKTHDTILNYSVDDFYNINDVKNLLQKKKLQLVDFRIPKLGERCLDFCTTDVFEQGAEQETYPFLIVKRIGKAITKVPPKVTVTIGVGEIYGCIPTIPLDYEYVAFRIPEDGEDYLALDGKVVCKTDAYVAKCPRVIVTETY